MPEQAPDSRSRNEKLHCGGINMLGNLAIQCGAEGTGCQPGPRISSQAYTDSHPASQQLSCTGFSEDVPFTAPRIIQLHLINCQSHSEILVLCVWYVCACVITMCNNDSICFHKTLKSFFLCLSLLGLLVCYPKMLHFEWVGISFAPLNNIWLWTPVCIVPQSEKEIIYFNSWGETLNDFAEWQNVFWKAKDFSAKSHPSHWQWKEKRKKKNLKELILSFSNFVSVRGSLTEHFYDASTDNGDKSTIPLLTGCKRDGLSSHCHHISFAPRSYEKWIGAQVQYCNWFPAVYQGP